MRFSSKIVVSLLLTLGTILQSQAQISDMLSNGSVSGNLNLRLESVSQNNGLSDADAFTLSSKIAFTTGISNGFSAMLEVEDVRIVGGVDSYSVGPTGFHAGQYSVIADPETTEVDQGFLQYRNDRLTAKLGRQVIVYDNHRFVGHVGWRQDRQTFDAFTAIYSASENLNLNYNFLDKRRRIFAEDADIDSSDHLFHADYKTDVGTVTAYAYLLEMDDVGRNSLDTYGARFNGTGKLSGTATSYLVEYATQSSQSSLADFDADYLLVELGATLLDGITAKLGYEILESDSGAYGFATPLSTLHAHNGWGDLFLNTPLEGLVDRYINVGGTLLGGNWAVVYHDFEAEDSSSSIKDYGNELDLQWVFQILENYTVGLKYAHYEMGDIGTARPDTDKAWIWFNIRF